MITGYNTMWIHFLMVPLFLREHQAVISPHKPLTLPVEDEEEIILSVTPSWPLVAIRRHCSVRGWRWSRSVQQCCENRAGCSTCRTHAWQKPAVRCHQPAHIWERSTFWATALDTAPPSVFAHYCHRHLQGVKQQSLYLLKFTSRFILFCVHIVPRPPVTGYSSTSGHLRQTNFGTLF